MTVLFNFENTYADSLDGLYAAHTPAGYPAPDLLLYNEPLASELGLSKEIAQISGLFTGNVVDEQSKPLAQAYAGHQFGSFSGLLGDGRAVLLGEKVDVQGKRKDIQLKGSGPTPFSRRGDGKATLASALREYLISEAMYQLGVPTSRSLAVATTGESMIRRKVHPGAVLTRVASSHIRVGTFELFAATEETNKLRMLADYTIARHYRELANEKDKYERFLYAVGKRQGELVARWMLVGFIHGVMNTDNVTVSGETLDYGPCAFMNHYDENTVFSSIDRHGRYAYGNQPVIGQWNNQRLAIALLPLIVPAESENQDLAQDIVREAAVAFKSSFDDTWHTGMCQKLGIDEQHADSEDLIASFLHLLKSQEKDFTLSFRELSTELREPYYEKKNVRYQLDLEYVKWDKRWRKLVMGNPISTADDMDKINPLYIPRNHRVEEALEAAEEGDLTLFTTLYNAVTNPYLENETYAHLSTPAEKRDPNYRTFCGT